VESHGCGKESIALNQPSTVLEGTWEELAAQVHPLPGQRFRLEILSPAVSLYDRPTGRYSARLRATLAEQAGQVATPEEMAEAERDLQELMHNMNETRRRAGAQPIF
jgi:hypothetical protein